jgi:tetratricopeptide (TPR) repeat protein
LEDLDMAKRQKPAKKVVPAAMEAAQTAPAARVKRTLFEKVITALMIAGALVMIYQMVDYETGWGNPGKVLKRQMADAEKDAIYKKYDAAIKAYSDIIGRWGKLDRFKEEIKQARLSLAKTYKDAEKNIEAINMYRELSAEYKDVNRDMYAWLLLELGDCYNSVLSTQDAIATYQTVVNEFAGSDWAAEALFGIAESYRNKKDFPNAIKYYDLIVSKYQKGFLSAEALTNKGRILEEQGKLKQALLVYEKVVKEFPDIVTEDARVRAEVLSGKPTKK